MNTPSFADLPGRPPGQSGQWRSLDQLANTPEFREAIEREFPGGASEWPEGLSRRRFLGLIGASLAYAGLSGCSRQPIEKMVPYVRQPPELTPGNPMFFATSDLLSGVARGILVESHEGRPTKIEGNLEHPASRGATDIFMQASVLQLYDPDRSQMPLRAGVASTWEAFVGEMVAPIARWRKNGGAGLRFLSGLITSPTLLDQAARLMELFPQARWIIHEPAVDITLPRAIHALSQADVILSIDADFLAFGPAQLASARQFASRRAPGDSMNRLYVAESSPSLTGASADHRFALHPDEILRLPAQLSALLAGQKISGAPQWLDAVARDLRTHTGRCAILAGDYLPAAMHHAVAALNGQLRAPVTMASPWPTPPNPESLSELAAEMHAGKVEALFILGENPVFTSPADLRFGSALAKVSLAAHLGLFADETAAACRWHFPETHSLEAWGDAAAFDGTLGILQPLIEPLYDGHSAAELLAVLLGESALSGYDLVRSYWRRRHGTSGFDAFWRRSLHDGVIPESIPPASFVASPRNPDIPKPHGLHLLIRPDPHVYDGRFANNAWLQELPKPLTKLVWENAAHIAPATARRLKLVHGDLVELKFHGRSVNAPLWVLPGMAEDCVLVHLGYGRTRAGGVGNRLGFDAYALRTSGAPWGGPGLEIRATGGRHRFATTQNHATMAETHPVRFATLAAYRENPAAALPEEPPPAPGESLFSGFTYDGNAWGMSIDLNTCIGCSACTIACQAENNIPVVGREQVMAGREMHWIRVDRYFDGPPESPKILHEPVPCMHCENAPCEVVCPVGATVHDHEGLNAMVYNRCIGTRYCSNNCPYKVRRFNFLAYIDADSPTLAMQRNPQVTVRSRGVMEKCTYCVQRISAARITAERENRAIRDGEIIPACAQACPAQAIRFGNVNDPSSRVSLAKADPRNYGLLAELNTRPRTTYLARIFNRNSEIA